MVFKSLFLHRKLPQGRELELLAEEMGVSRFDAWVEKHGQTGLDESELQKRVLEAMRARRESWLWLFAFLSALASLASALAAWLAVYKG